MVFEIRYKRSVEKDLSRIHKQEVIRILEKIDAELGHTPDRFPALKGEFQGLRRMRVGDYRIIFTITDNAVLILHIGHRKNIYK